VDRLGAHALSDTLVFPAAGHAPLPVIVNCDGGTARAKGDALRDEIEQAFSAADRAITLMLVEGKDVASAVERHRASARIVVGGGDGTIGQAAGVLAGSDAELALLPLGTRNHLARQLGVPLELADAAKLAASGNATAMDLGSAGDRTFVNNASLGAYVHLVRLREASSLPKWLASIIAGWRVLRNLRPSRFDLDLDGEPRTTSTAMLFIGNNVYEVSQGKPGTRAALDGGVLSVVALAPMTRGELVLAAMRVALGRPDMARDFAVQTTARKVVIRGEGTTAMALDGEWAHMPLPLTIHIRPGALQVVAPDA
jgi:diacylglycerol kinase family enzyme